jgi:hypothetical protein
MMMARGGDRTNGRDGYHSKGRNGFMSQENMTNMPDKVLPHYTLYSAPCRWHNMCGLKLLRVSPCRWCEKLPGGNVPTKRIMGWEHSPMSIRIVMRVEQEKQGGDQFFKQL